VRGIRRILLVALAVRLLAVFLAPGYLMSDDHFLTVEPASSWAVGQNFNNWKPGIDNERQTPESISFFYPGALSVAFKMMHQVGIHDPSRQMVVIRFLHALWSLLTIFFAYRIAQRIGDQKSAELTGWLLALIGILPNFSVRNLVEVACQPLLLGGIFLLVRYGAMRPFKLWKWQFHSGSAPGTISLGWILAAGFIMGLAAGVRYQTVLIIAATGFVLLMQGSVRQFVVFGLFAFSSFFLTQIDDVILWGGKPFQHLTAYFEYNKTHAGDYPGAPFTYLSFIGYFILPPVSLFLFWGFIRSFRNHLLLFLPIAFFILFHILYPNRQERFILPALPVFVLLGVIGWNEWIRTSQFWINRERLHRNLWRFFWGINTIVLLVMSTTYSKRSRVESMYYLYSRGDCRNFIQEFTHKSDIALLPRHYLGSWVRYYPLSKNSDVDYVISVMPSNAENFAHRLEPQPIPNYMLFVDDNDLESRVDRMRNFFPEIHFCTSIEPAWFDVLLHRINPMNTVERIHIYKLETPWTLTGSSILNFSARALFLESHPGRKSFTSNEWVKQKGEFEDWRESVR